MNRRRSPPRLSFSVPMYRSLTHTPLPHVSLAFFFCCSFARTRTWPIAAKGGGGVDAGVFGPKNDVKNVLNNVLTDGQIERILLEEL